MRSAPISPQNQNNLEPKTPLEKFYYLSAKNASRKLVLTFYADCITTAWSFGLWPILQQHRLQLLNIVKYGHINIFTSKKRDAPSAHGF